MPRSKTSLHSHTLTGKKQQSIWVFTAARMDMMLDWRTEFYSSGLGQKGFQWVSLLNSNRRGSVRLICFPYSGGDSSKIFRTWTEYIAPEVELWPVQLPGRGSRIAEPACESIAEVVQALALELDPLFDKPFALFGHSLGALMCFELARLLRRRSCPEPVHLFVSGARAPQIPRFESPSYQLPRPEFLKRLQELNGTPAEVLKNSELMELLLPTLRADFKSYETYSYSVEEPLLSPITAFGGQEDLITVEEVGAWREQTRGGFSLRLVPGGHFFIHGNGKFLADTVSRTLQI